MLTRDIMEKTLEAYDDVFADICNGLLFHGEQRVRPEALMDAQAFSFYKAGDEARAQERDIAKYWQDCAIRIALFGFENQSAVFKRMPLRVIGYDGAAYRAQLNGDAEPVYPVVTLVLYFGQERWKSRSLFDCMRVPDALRPFVNDYRINVFEIAYLTDEQIDCFHSDFRILADYFTHSRVDPDYRPKNPRKFKHAAEVLELLSVFEDKRYMELNDSEGGLPENMCEVLDRAINKGIAIGETRGEARGLALGEARGLALGEARGLAKGSLLRARETALNLRDMVGMKDPGMVAKVVNVAVEQVERWFAEA